MSNPDDPIIIEPVTAADACVIWLHGLGADGHDFESAVPALNLDAGHRIRFVFPNAPVMPVTINGGMAMRAWYDIAETDLRRAPDAAGIERSMSAISTMLYQQIHNGIASERIILAGFSQGGAVALHVATEFPERLAGILALSTYLPLPDRLPPAANSANANTPIFMAHGLNDPMIPAAVAQASWQHLVDHAYVADWHVYSTVHSVCLEELQDIGRWISAVLQSGRD